MASTSYTPITANPNHEPQPHEDYCACGGDFSKCCDNRADYPDEEDFDDYADYDDWEPQLRNRGSSTYRPYSSKHVRQVTSKYQ